LVRSTCVISQFGVNFINRESLSLNLDFIEDSFGELSGDIDNSRSTISGTTTLGLKLNKDSEKVVTLSSSEIDFSVRMHSKGERSLSGELIFNVFLVLIVSSSNGALERSFSIRIWEKFSLIKELLIE